MLTVAHRIQFALFPTRILPRWVKRFVAKYGLIRTHFAILLLLYSLVFLSAAAERTFYIPQGIGILQNPPFLAQLIASSFSIYIPYIMTKRIASAFSTSADKVLLPRFVGALRRSKAKTALFNVAVLFGLAALAYTVVLSASYKENIYDAVRHKVTFSSYFLLRCYQYGFCYPAMVVGCVVLVHYLFAFLRTETVPYQPFHYDETGGLQKYFEAVDRPVYIVQSLAVLIAVMNYWGWGGMKFVPLLQSIAVPVLVTALAFLLIYRFNRLLGYKKDQEIRTIRLQEMELYLTAKELARLSPQEHSELLDRIEGMERLVAIIKARRQRGWQKYIINLGIVVITQLTKPVAAGIAAQFLSLTEK